MNAAQIISQFGIAVTDEKMETLFASLDTLRRPALDADDPYIYHDWVLIRRKGIELGFTDSEYQSSPDRFRWGHGELLLTQAYFYSGFDHVRPFTGTLPHALAFGDSRDTARSKLAAFESSRHSYLNDTWDVDGYRLSVTYADDGSSIDRMACRMLAVPLPRRHPESYPDVTALPHSFGTLLASPDFLALWPDAITKDDYQAARHEGEIDLTETHGASLAFIPSGAGPVFRSITLHRNRDRESVGWGGALPNGLTFDDSPETLFTKIASLPVQQSDSPLTGHAVWHFDDYTLHVLYSNVDNRLLRVKLIAPGTWRCIDDAVID